MDLSRILAGEPAAVARAISLVENGSADAAPLMTAVRAHGQHPFIVGLTGPPGAGKSTLVDRLIAAYRATGARVAVLAVDPSSPYTGGAILGDRVRMQTHAGDANVFVRSMATRGQLGGLAAASSDAAAILGAAGYAVVLIETVGVGQAEVDIARMADVTVVVFAPGAGDDVQALKAGIMEIADVFVVNKADRDGADKAAGAIRATMALRPHAAGEWQPPVVRTVATTGDGVPDLVAAIEACRADRQTHPTRATRTRDAIPRAMPLDHVGIAVADAGPLAAIMHDLFDLDADAPEDVGPHRVRFIQTSGATLELVEALTPDAPVAKFLQKKGDGLHHICLRVPDIDAALRMLTARGVRLIDHTPRPGAHGSRIAFLHPSSTGGILVEIKEDALR